MPPPAPRIGSMEVFKRKPCIIEPQGTWMQPFSLMYAENCPRLWPVHGTSQHAKSPAEYVASEAHGGPTSAECMQAQFDAAMRHKQALEEDAQMTQQKMDSANALLSALAGEETRWTEQSKEFDDTIQRLTGNLKHLLCSLSEQT